ncbi:MAG: 2-hydroxychromene-2-carboxylate isomerase [Deltaproteobacteria bacterium]|nr:2-hydroxychromene-2-carboxylate isomerase [Deltaproteobacteria bacterium]
MTGYDVASPFAYLALTQVPALAAAGARVRLVPILLGGLFRDIGQHDVPLLAFPPAKQAYVRRDMDRWARWWGVPFAMPSRFPQRTVAAQRLVLVADPARALPLAIALGRAMWAEGRDLEDEATLRAILDGVGESPALVDRTRDADVKARLAANTAAARDAGVFGVPTFVTRTVVDGLGSSADGSSGPSPVGTRLFWGQDRLELVARTLAGWDCPP